MQKHGCIALHLRCKCFFLESIFPTYYRCKKVFWPFEGYRMFSADIWRYDNHIILVTASPNIFALCLVVAYSSHDIETCKLDSFKLEGQRFLLRNQFSATYGWYNKFDYQGNIWWGENLYAVEWARTKKHIYWYYSDLSLSLILRFSFLASLHYLILVPMYFTQS